MRGRTSSSWRTFLVPVVATVAASLIGAALKPLMGETVLYPVYFVAVTASAWFGGWGAGVLATALTFLAANWLFIAPDRAFHFNVAAFTYILVCLAITGFNEAMRRALRRAEASAEQVISLVESITDGFIALDKQGRCTYMNRAAEEFHRRFRPHAGGSWDLVPLPASGDAEARLKQALANQAEVEFESFHEPSGRWFEIQASPADAGGLAIRYRDTTERKLARLALARSEERLRLAQQGANAGLWDWDLSGGEITWSAEYYEIFGLDRSCQPSFETFLESVYPDDRARVEQAVVAMQLQSKPLDIQLRTVHPRKGLRWIACLGHSTTDASGRPLRMTGIVLDITDRKRAEEHLRFFSEAGMLLSALADPRQTMQQIARLAVPFFADWCVVDLQNPLGCLERVAVAHRDLAGEPALKALIEQSALGWDSAAVAARVFDSGQPALVSEITPEFIDRSSRDPQQRRLYAQLDPVSLITVPLVVRERTIGTILFVIAESARHYSPAELELAAELGRRAAVSIDNARLYRELKRAEQQKDDFLAMLAHELRNPLAAVLYANETLKLTDQSHNPAVEVIDRQVANLSYLINDLLDVSRITQDKIQLKKELVGGESVLQRALATAGPQLNEPGHELCVEISSEPMPLEADPTRIEQVLVNLLTNAAKYTPENGVITVRAFPRDDWAVFMVRDTGIGISAEMLPRVFELFTQVDQSLDRSQGGLGIGLTVVRKLVEMHGGRVSVASEGLDQGSEFTVSLPLTHKQAPAPAEAQTARADGPATQKILVVDDNVDTAESISCLLKGKGYTAAIAHDGHAALRVARSFSPDVVLLDLGLPGLDGYRVAQTLRSEGLFPNVRLIALSGYGQPADRKRTQEAGFNDHLIKPVALNKLLSVLAGH